MSKEGSSNFAPIGVLIPDGHCERSIGEVGLRLYPGSQTYENLETTREAVICFTDDMELLVETALYSFTPPSQPSRKVQPPRLAEALTVWEIEITEFDESRIPAVVEGRVIDQEERPGFLGFCRAQMAVTEATIAATRLKWVIEQEIIENWQHWLELVRKTGGIKERKAFGRIADYLREQGITVKKLE